MKTCSPSFDENIHKYRHSINDNTGSDSINDDDAIIAFIIAVINGN